MAPQLLVPSSMPRLIRLCVSQSRPMKPAVKISRGIVEAAMRALKSHSACDASSFQASPSSTLLRGDGLRVIRRS